MKRDASCSFCNSRMDVDKVVEGPGNVHICYACCDLALSSPQKQQGTCSFCRKSSSSVGPLMQSDSGALICGECAKFCQYIIKQVARKRAEENDRSD